MTAVGGNICWGRAVGVCLAEGRLTITEVASTLAGRKVLSTASQPIEGTSPGKVLAQWLGSHLTPRQRRHVSVCVGLGAEQTFFTTRVLHEEQQKERTTESLLAASGIGLQDAAVDFVRSKHGGDFIYTIAACPRAVATEIFEALQQAGVRDCRLEPAPRPLLRMNDHHSRPPRSWKTFVRALLNEGGGLAVLVSGEEAILWRRFPLIAGQEDVGIASAIRHIQVHVSQKLPVPSPSGLLLQGKEATALAPKVSELLGLKVIAMPSEPVGDRMYSLAAATPSKKPDEASLNLFKSLRPPPTILQMFPRRLAQFLVVLVLAMAGILWNAASEIEKECQNLRRQDASYAWAKDLKTAAIEKERKVLQEEVSAVQQFLGTRVVWSDYLRDLPTRLPPNSCLLSIQASYEMPDLTGKKNQRKTNRSLVLQAMALFSDRGAAPKEIDSFLDSLRGVEMLKRDFPVVNLAEIRWRKEGKGSDVAMYTVVATPKVKPAPGAGGAKADKE